MKKYLLCCVVVFAFLFQGRVNSQDTSTIQGLLQHIMQPLNKDQIPNGYLEEYGFPGIKMATFNGTLSTNNRIDMNLWRFLYMQLFTSWTRTTANPMTPITTINSVIKSNTSPTLPTPIPLLIGEYNTVRSDAFSSNLLSYNAVQRRVFDVAGRTQNPYQSTRLFAAAPEKVYSLTGSESFIYRSNMVWGNTNLTITQLQIDFGNGLGFRTLTANTPVSVSYTTEGDYVWVVRATLSNSSVVQCYVDYSVISVPTTGQRYAGSNIATPAWGNIAAVAGVHSGAQVSVVYSTKQPLANTIRKPLIVVEDMDAFSLAPSLQPAPFRIGDFIRQLQRPLNDISPFDFNYQLDDIAGYDLIFIDFNNGTDGIVRNAAVVQAVINAVNQVKQTDNRSGRREENVVLGLGTGGLNARYALANMTKNFPSTRTETRLLITHDAPHKGANLPVGLQHFARMLANISIFGISGADVFPDYAEMVAFFNAPVNVETLLYRATTDVANTANTFLNTTYRNMVEFSPASAQPYRFVPTSLGNECATPLFSAGRPFFDFGMGFSFGTKGKLEVFGFKLLSFPVSDYKYDCAVYAGSIPAPTVTNRQVAKLTLTFKYSLFGFISVHKVGFDKVAEAPTSFMAIDGVPGSYETLLGFDELRNLSNAIGNWSHTVTLAKADLFDFKIGKLKLQVFAKAYQYNSGVFSTQYTAVPVGSALDVQPFNSAVFTQNFVNGSNPNFPSSGNTFIAQETVQSQSLFNNAVLRFTSRNARFIFNEMESLPNTLHCSAQCANPFYISGPADLCSGTNIYTIPGLPRGTTVAWTLPVNPGGITSVSANANGAALTRIGNVPGMVRLEAIFTNACTGFQVTLSRVIVVGPPPIGIVSFNNMGACAGEGNFQVLSTVQPNVFNYSGSLTVGSEGGSAPTWSLAPGTTTNGWTWTASGPTVTVSTKQFNTRLVLRATSSNACGSSFKEYHFNSGQCSSMPVERVASNSFAIKPNPARSSVTIVNLNESPVEIRQVIIKNRMGAIVKSERFAGPATRLTINISNLRPDFYFVHIYDGVNWTSQKLFKE